MEISDQKTLRERLLEVLHKMGPMSVRGLSEVTRKGRGDVREKLLIAEKHGHVTDKWIRRPTPTGYMIMTHSYYITDRGIEWLKERGIISS